MSRARPLARVAQAALAALLLGGCVYYNGMYNAKRLAGSARKAEREGRTFEANNLWGQVITRAESLVVRHPHSKYVEEALTLKGIALARLGQCPDAVTPLARVSAFVVEGETGEEAALALGRCQLELGDPVAADLAFSHVVESADPARRRDARLYRARALRQLGRPEQAILALEGIGGPKASEERLLSLGAAGREAETLALADSVLAVNDSVRTWDSVLTIVGRHSPATASALVDHLGSRGALPVEIRARRLYQDGERLGASDPTRALDRFRRAARIGGGTDPGDRASLQLIRRDLARTRAPSELSSIADSLGRLAAAGRSATQEARALRQAVIAVRAAADSSGTMAGQGDLRLFLAAESARDSLLAPALAAGLFRQVVETWPDSPYAPKALLAGRVLDPEWGEAMRPLLEERYASSPYLAILRGEDATGYRELEDSLQTYAFSTEAGRRRPAAPGVRRPGSPRSPAPGEPVIIRNPRNQRPDPSRGLEP
ncbi:MAG: hypothetical protein H0W29_08225 [Gemmatimonadales bacterium]|nr:hypothetical protein [Gemmatimonadales bacterium]